MLGSFVTRFRILMLVLAFGLGLGGQIVSNAAMASQMQASAQPGFGHTSVCPGCGDMQQGNMALGCSAVTVCWTVPALPAQGTALERQPATTFPGSADLSSSGIASAPDPHPPRSLRRS